MDAMNVQLDQAAIHRLLLGDDGPTVQYMWTLTRRTRNYAILEAPSRNGPHAGYLKQSHQYTVDVEGNEIVGKVGATANYAIYVHEGTKPHVITAKNVYSVTTHRRHTLAFTVGGKTIFRVSVNHPGNKPNRWLIRAAQRAGITATPTGA